MSLIVWTPAFADKSRGNAVLDLTDLNFADRHGVRVLRELMAQGAQPIGVSRYFGLLLGETPSEGN